VNSPGDLREPSGHFAAGLRSPLPLIRLGKQLTQPIEPSLPCRPVLLHPLVQRVKSSWFQTAGAYPPNLFRVYKAALFQHLQVLAYGRQGDLQRAR